MDRGGRWGDGQPLPGATTDEGNSRAEIHHNRNFVWDTIGLAWVRMTQPGGSGGGGGGPATIADGADVAEGATTDAAVTSDTTGTVSGKLRGLVKWAFERMPASLGQKAMSASLPVVIASDQSALTVGTHAVTGPLTDTQLRAAVVPVDTELPTAVALADNLANPTVPQVGAHAMIWDSAGANWDRQLQPLTDTQLRASAVPVDVSDRSARLVGVVSGGANVFHVDDNAGTITVDAPVGTPVFSRLSDGAAALIGQKAMAASLPVALASDQGVLPAVLEQRAATLHVTATAAVNTAVTLTLPAPGAGIFHYITSIQLVKLYAVVGTAAAAGVLVTSTNLPGNPVWTTEQAAGPLGTAPVVINYQPTTPLKSSVANTATTLVAPLQAQTIWRWNVSYFTAA
jgi:hypothetical protein